MADQTSTAALQDAKGEDAAGPVVADGASAGVHEGGKADTEDGGKAVPEDGDKQAGAQQADIEEQEEELAIFKAIESTREQIHENQQRKAREHTIAYRQFEQQHQQHAKAEGDEQAGEKPAPEKKPKPSAYMPRGIPMSMVVAQAQPEEGVRLRACSAAHRTRADLEHSSHRWCSQSTQPRASSTS